MAVLAPFAPMERMSARSLAVLFGVSVLTRWLASAGHNIAGDPFVLVESAKHLLETGLYRIPSIGSSDAVLRWSLPSWPAGFPLLLAAMFSIFGPTETVARATTIVVAGLLAPLSAYLAFRLSGRKAVALLAGGVAVLHPLAVAFSGQIFTNNVSVTLFTASLCALVAATMRGDGAAVVPFGELLASSRRRLCLLGAAFLFGLMLSVRDTGAMLVGPSLYLLYRSGAFKWRVVVAEWRAFSRVLAAAALALMLGWFPGLYFNKVNFGSFFMSAHYETNIRLSVDYLLHGSDAFFGLPGIAVMALAVAVFQFPVLLALSAWARDSASGKIAAVLAGLVALPLLLVNGAFPVASTGAAPRYVLPLVPFACLFSALALRRAFDQPRTWPAVVVAAVLIGWQAVLFYPPPGLFRAWSRLGYLAYYSPAYVKRSYQNYPDHTNAVVRWVAANTPTTALIVTPSRAQHFYYYGHRDVSILDTLSTDDWVQHVQQRPVYFVEDKNLALRSEQVDALRATLGERQLRLVTSGYVEVFTPEAGTTKVRAYRVTHGPTSRS